MPTIWNQVRRVMNNYGARKDTLISLIDRDGNLYSMNSEMRKMLELPASEKEKTNIFDFVHEKGIKEFKQSVLLCEREKIPADSQLLFKNGQDHLVSLKIHAIPRLANNKQLFLCMGEEIKKTLYRKQPAATVEKKLFIPTPSTTNMRTGSLNSDRQILNDSVLMNSPVITWMINEEEELVFANHAFRKYFSLPDEAVNQDIRKFIHPKVIQSLYEKHLDVYMKEKPVISVEKAFFANGETLHFQVFLFTAIQDGGKKVVVGQAYQLNEIPQTESKYRLDENKIINNLSNDAIWEWDMITGKIFRNNALLQMIGFSDDEPVGLVWWLKRIHPVDRKRISDTIKEAADKGLSSWKNNYHFKCADGSFKAIQDQGYIIYENGLPVKMIGSLQDVSEIKKLQEMLEKERKDRQELSESIMHVQERERTWIGYELHDNINQILTTVNLFIEQLKVTGSEQIKLKDKSTEYLLNAIEEIRQLSKGLVIPQLKEKGLLESIQTMIDDLHVSDGPRIDFIHDCKVAQLNAGRQVTLFRIVQEQLKNILKYSQASKAEVHICCKNRLTTLVIKDNGKGFDPGQTSRGIGLSNIFERTKFYKGTAVIETAPGMGCKLTIKIPFE
ncbi:MAG: PAS domain S-box protein [Chitinophagaceae bacterium]